MIRVCVCVCVCPLSQTHPPREVLDIHTVLNYVMYSISLKHLLPIKISLRYLDNR